MAENPHLDPDLYKNYLLTCFCPLELAFEREDGTDGVIWKNPHPNSLAYTRPLSLIRTHEERDVIEAEFSDLFSEIRLDTEQVISMLHVASYFAL